MTSKIKVDNINKVSDDSNIIKKCGTTTTIGSGASNPIVVDGSAITLGRCGGTVALASGATQTGFGRSGSVNWETTPKTSTFTPANGEGYFVNTSGGVITANLPAGSAGAIVAFADYTRTFDSNSFTISPNGSDKIGGESDDLILSTAGQALTLIFVDATEGWINVQNATDTETGAPPFVTATGGTVTTSGNFKIHTFTGPGTFEVQSVAPGPSGNPNSLDYVVVGGGGAGGPCVGAGGGAGGTRFSNGTATGCYTATPGPLGASALTASVASFPITVGAGTAGAGNPSNVTLARGSSSVFSTITSTGGGSGGGGSGTSAPIETTPNGSQGGSGGSGGGGGFRSGQSGGSGNTPPVSPAQGTSGGSSTPSPSPTTIDAGGGGGGAISSGSDGANNNGGNGGTGITNSITASPVQYGGGGGGAACAPGPAGGTKGTGGGGGGGQGGNGSSKIGTSGTANTGGGGGGSIGTCASGSGGSGIVIIRYKFQ